MSWRDREPPANCTIARLDSPACQAVLAHLRGGPPAQGGPVGPWLLAHLDGGVVWGHRSPDGAWRLSGDAYPKVSPPLAADALQHARIFGGHEELLIWRVPGGLRGRRLTDLDDGDRQPGPLAPCPQRYVLRADRLLEHPREGFSLVGDAGGSRHAVPLHCEQGWFERHQWPLGLLACHYLQADPDSGAVRIATSRLVRLTVPGSR